MDRPTTAQGQRGDSLRNPDQDPLSSELDPGAATNTEVFFKVVALNPAQKKFVRVAVGAGSKLKDTQVAISLFR
eukprot:5885071-Alexandrium_andersonii.AAC.1